jgi:O-antigen/teichoic acid export membrane protein
VKRYISLQSLPFGWKKEIFKEIFSYSVHLQLSSLMAMFLEPVTKIILGYFGSMASVGYFDMANRLVMQVRNIIVNANQAVVPMLSKYHTEGSNLYDKYIQNLKILLALSLVSNGVLAFLTPFISKIWIGSVEKEFIDFSYIIIFSIAINLIAGAAYFTNMANGMVKYNSYSQIVIAVLNISLSLILGFLYSSYGVVIGYGIAIVLGSLWLVLKTHFLLKGKQ